jgi:hypothetical protein
MLALLGLQQLHDLELVQVFGFGLTELNPRALEEAIAGLTNLHRLHVSAVPAYWLGSLYTLCHRATLCCSAVLPVWICQTLPVVLLRVQVDSESVKCRVPSLHPLASLHHMRQLAIRQALPLSGFDVVNLLQGATNLGQLQGLQSFDLQCATITDSSNWLAALPMLTQVRLMRRMHTTLLRGPTHACLLVYDRQAGLSALPAHV